MLLASAGGTKYVTHYRGVGIGASAISGSATQSEQEYGYGSEDEASQSQSVVSEEEIILPEGDEEEDEEDDVFLDDLDEELLERQMSYPPLPEYIPPDSDTDLLSSVSGKKKKKRRTTRERLGVLTPMEEVTEPPSSAGTDISHSYRQRRRKTEKGTPKEVKEEDAEEQEEEEGRKEIEEPPKSPRRVTFQGSTGQDNKVIKQEQGFEDAQEDEDGKFTAKEVEEIVKRVGTWDLENSSDNGDDKDGNIIDAEFPSILDDIISDLHSWDEQSFVGTQGVSISEITASRQNHLSDISATLSSYISQVKASTIISNLPQLIPLLTTLLGATESNFRAQLAALNTVTAFSNRLKECKNKAGMKVLPNADLAWLVRVLCTMAADSSRSVLKTVGTATLASLVKQAGPEMILDPILFILMGKDEKVPRRPEGSGNIVTTGMGGGPPRVKATALDTLTFALLTFPRDNFDLQKVGKLACHCLLHPKRRMRQAALECLAVVAHCMGGSHTIPLFKEWIAAEEKVRKQEEDAEKKRIAEENIPPPRTPSPPPKYYGNGYDHQDPDLSIDPHTLISPPSKIPVPIRSQPSSPVKMKKPPPPSPKKDVSHAPVPATIGPTPSSAVSARVSRHLLPTPNLEELVEYGVKIPGNSQLLSRQVKQVANEGGMKRNGGIRSSSGDSSGSVSNVEYSVLDLQPVLGTHGSGGSRGRGSRKASQGQLTMAADVEWILEGAGPVKRCDPSTMLPRDVSALTRPAAATAVQNQNRNSSGGGTESDFSDKPRDLDLTEAMRRADIRSELLQDAFVQEPVVGRYYYPHPHPPGQSPRGLTMTRYTPKMGYNYNYTGYNLLPSKHHILRNSNTNLPNGFEYDNGSQEHEWHSELGNLASKVKPMKPLPLPSSKVEGHNQSEGEFEESEGENDVRPQEVLRSPVKSSTKKAGTAAAAKPPLPPNTTTRRRSQIQDEISVRRQTEMMQPMGGMPRDFQVYHSHHTIEVGQGQGQGPPTTNTSTTKRGDADSAGSNQTRDSGVSFGSKTPPSAQNTPPTQHRKPPVPTNGRGPSPSAGLAPQRSGDKGRRDLNKSWRSTPDVPHQLAVETSSSYSRSTKYADDVNSRHSGIEGRKGSRTKLVSSTSSSDENMPLHRRPVLARRGQSHTMVPDPEQDLPQLQLHIKPNYSPPSLRNGSGDHFSDGEDDDEEEEVTNKVYSSSLSPPQQMRPSFSTGNLSKETDSKNMYYEINGREEREHYLPPGRRTGRLSSRKEGPFGDVQQVVSLIDDRSRTLPRTNKMNVTRGKVVPTKVYKGSFREINGNRGVGIKGTSEVFPADLKPVTSPKHALPAALGQLESAEWETNVQGFRQLVRMIRFDSDVIRNDLHTVNMTGIRHLTNLRSQVCRAAILCFKELFIELGKAMEPDCEKIAEKLLDKSADTNKFIREDSVKTLETMIDSITAIRGITCLDLFGTRHRNPVVRCTTSKLAVRLVEAVGVERSLSELSERLLPMLCKFLQEGSLETRTAAKRAMSQLMTHPAFFALLKRHVPSDVLRGAQKNIEALQK